MKREVTYCRKISLRHLTGDVLFPVKSLNMDTGRETYRYSSGGLGGNNKKVAIQETDSEDEITRMVKVGKSVRCRTLPAPGKNMRDGMYTINGRSIVGYQVHEFI